jgi:hypothetical protein
MNQHTTTSLFEEIGLCDCTKKNVIYVERKGNIKTNIKCLRGSVPGGLNMP